MFRSDVDRSSGPDTSSVIGVELRGGQPYALRASDIPKITSFENIGAASFFWDGRDTSPRFLPSFGQKLPDDVPSVFDRRHVVAYVLPEVGKNRPVSINGMFEIARPAAPVTRAVGLVAAEYGAFLERPLDRYAEAAWAHLLRTKEAADLRYASDADFASGVDRLQEVQAPFVYRLRGTREEKVDAALWAHAVRETVGSRDGMLLNVANILSPRTDMDTKERHIVGLAEFSLRHLRSEPEMAVAAHDILRGMERYFAAMEEVNRRSEVGFNPGAMTARKMVYPGYIAGVQGPQDLVVRSSAGIANDSGPQQPQISQLAAAQASRLTNSGLQPGG